MKSYETIGHFLRGCRIKNNIEQSEIAKLLKVDKTYISKIESKNVRRVIRKEENIKKLADVYGFDISEYQEIAKKQLKEASSRGEKI